MCDPGNKQTFQWWFDKSFLLLLLMVVMVKNKILSDWKTETETETLWTEKTKSEKCFSKKWSILQKIHQIIISHTHITCFFSFFFQIFSFFHSKIEKFFTIVAHTSCRLNTKIFNKRKFFSTFFFARHFKFEMMIITMAIYAMIFTTNREMAKKRKNLSQIHKEKKKHNKCVWCVF